MPPSRHTPDPDAPAGVWTDFLKGRGYVPDDHAKPVSNYKSFHGFWVPPRLGSAKKAATTPARAGAQGGTVKPEKAWYSQKMLTLLYRSDRATFDKLVERVRDIKQLVAEQENLERIAEHRALLEPAVEAGLLNQGEADRKLAAWAKSQGITLPQS